MNKKQNRPYIPDLKERGFTVNDRKEVCKCNPSKSINEVLNGISSKDLDEDIKEIVDNNFDELL